MHKICRNLARPHTSVGSRLPQAAAQLENQRGLVFSGHENLEGPGRCSRRGGAR